MTTGLILVRDSSDSHITCEDKDERIATTTKALMKAMDTVLNSTSHDNAIRNLAELKELLDVMDMLQGREISRSQVNLRETFGGYDKFKLEGV